MVHIVTSPPNSSGHRPKIYVQATNLYGFNTCSAGGGSQQCWYMSITDCGLEDLLITCCSFMTELLNGFRMLMSCNDTENSKLVMMILYITSCAACGAAATICPRPPLSSDLNRHKELSAWRSLRTSAIQVIIPIRPCTKIEVRRPSCSEDMAAFWSRH